MFITPVGKLCEWVWFIIASDCLPEGESLLFGECMEWFLNLILHNDYVCYKNWKNILSELKNSICIGSCSPKLISQTALHILTRNNTILLFRQQIALIIRLFNLWHHLAIITLNIFIFPTLLLLLRLTLLLFLNILTFIFLLYFLLFYLYRLLTWMLMRTLSFLLYFKLLYFFEFSVSFLSVDFTK